MNNGNWSSGFWNGKKRTKHTSWSGLASNYKHSEFKSELRFEGRTSAVAIDYVVFYTSEHSHLVLRKRITFSLGKATGCIERNQKED